MGKGSEVWEVGILFFILFIAIILSREVEHLKICKKIRWKIEMFSWY